MLYASFLGVFVTAGRLGSAKDVDTWCGKAYRPG